MSRLVIRADAGGKLGTGHVMRMLALAQAWSRRGGRVTIATASCPESLVERILKEGFQHQAIECDAPGDPLDAAATVLAASEWIVLDGYHFRGDFQQTCRDAGLKTLCVDDYGHCPEWFCDILLNQNLGADRGKLPMEPEEILMGISYALLRQEFLNFPRDTKPWQPLKKILVTLGGSDPPNATAWVLSQLAKTEREDLTVRVIIGPANPHREILRAMELPFEAEWKEAVTDMPAQYAWADGVISAGGSSCWEWLYFGLPGAVVTIAENQEPVVRELRKQKTALCLGWPSDGDGFAKLSGWIDDPARFIDQAAASSLVDGRGADRVVSHIDGTGCLIRRMDPKADARFTFDLANDPSVRSAGYSTDMIPWETHCGWLAQHHASPDSFLFIVEGENRQPVGSLRFRRDGESWEIGIALDPGSRGHGYAENGIRLGMGELAVIHGIRKFHAIIRPTNMPSKKLFQRLGFTHRSTVGEREHWIHILP